MESVSRSLLVLALLAIVGCGDGSLAPVVGQVTLDGEPVTAGMVHFVPATGPAASAVIEDDGTYELSTRSSGDGAVIGKHQVYLSAPPTDLGSYSLDDYQENREPEDQAGPAFPKKYLAPQTSGLSFEVVPGSNEINIELVK